MDIKQINDKSDEEIAKENEKMQINRKKTRNNIQSSVVYLWLLTYDVTHCDWRLGSYTSQGGKPPKQYNANNPKMSLDCQTVKCQSIITSTSSENPENFEEIDHMYATNGEIIENRQTVSCLESRESEVRFIKEWLILHTDLIQQQNDDILEKDAEIFLLRRENEMLKAQINCIEKGIPYHNNQNNKFNNNHSNNQTTKEEDEEEKKQVYIFEEENSQEDKTKEIVVINQDMTESHKNKEGEKLEKKDDNNFLLGEFLDDNIGFLANKRGFVSEKIDFCEKSEFFEETRVKSDFFDGTSVCNNSKCSFEVDLDSMRNLKMSIRRKRMMIKNDDDEEESFHHEIDDEKNVIGRIEKKIRRLTKDANILTSSEAYVTQSHDVNLGIPPTESDFTECLVAASLEVPRWRHKIYASCYTMEGTENLDDEVFNKRHLRLENGERRRKRWDVQRIREQRIIEKLKQRQDKNNSKCEDQILKITSLWPKIEDIKFLEISDELPVAAFGAPILKINPSEFEIPWMRNPGILSKKTPNSRKSTIRRRISKR